MQTAVAGRTKNGALRGAMENTLATFAVTRIFHLGIMLTEDASINDDLQEFVQGLEAEELDRIQGLDLPRFRKLIVHAEDDEDEEALLAEFAWECEQKGLHGFLCEVRCPRVEVLKGKGTKQLTWGIQHMRWFYDEDLAGIIQQADAWAKSEEQEVEKFGGGRLRVASDEDQD